MANDRADFELWLKSKWDGDAMAAAQASFKKTKSEAKELEGGLDELGYSAKNLKSILVEAFALTELIAQFKEGFEQVAALEQSFNQLERAAKRNGENFDTVKKKAVDFADSLKEMAGLDDDAVIKQVTKLYTATGDLANSMEIARLAADVAVGSNMDFEQALQLVTSAAQGKTRALVTLGLAQDDDTAKTLTAAEALKRIQSAYGGAASEAKGLTVEVNRLKEKWEDVRNTVVERVTPSIAPAIKIVESFFLALNGAYELVSETLVRIFGGLVRLGEAATQLVSGDFAGAKNTFKAGISEITGIGDAAVRIAKENAAKIEAVWTDAEKKVAAGTTGKTPGALGGGGGSKQQESRDEASWVLIDGVLYKRDDIEKATEDLYKKAKARADLEEKFAEARRKREWKDERDTQRQITQTREDEMHARTRLILEEVRLKKAAAEHEKAMQLEVANAAVGLAGQMFGESKALAIAQAVINTYEGATKALSQGGIYGPVLAAIVIASGLAQVAKISSTNPDRTAGSGFDDPRNDAAAYLGGRRWAADMIGEWTKGVSSGWASGMGAGGGGNVTYDNRSTMNVHMNVAGMLDPNNQHMMAQFARNLAVVNKTVEGQRSTARTAR